MVSTEDTELARLLHEHMPPLDGVAPTWFRGQGEAGSEVLVRSYVRQLRPPGVAGLELTQAPDRPQRLRVRVTLRWFTWAALGLWHLWACWFVYRRLGAIVLQPGVWLRVRPW